ncbi:caspase domain-containing protein [Mycena pura]|uniref:Caspase domain-containing protein n=1 Tax=Mycena pura TaxID=153505 RepID=A0AAD6UZN0_9AGAR|nr:caspase domain-containing protein [Mycena pura]
MYLEISAGTTVHKTTSARGVVPHTWDERFNFTLAPSEDVTLSLYKTLPFGKPVLIGRVPLIVDLEPRDQDVVKTFPSAYNRRHITVTYQLREPERNLSARCSVFAFILGIDEYISNSIPNLRGCVHDAQTVKNLLTNRFHIPERQIAFLTNQDATREAILDKFRTHLITNASIQKDDTIIVYYAGHGSRAPAPESWPATDGKIETIVPHDERGRNAQGETIHGIPDRTVNMLLNALASAKGNNITVILDCCHSGGISRGSGSSVLPDARFVETFEPIPENLDRNFLENLNPGGRSAQVVLPPGINYKFMHSHVLLAACRQQQRARECISAEGKPCGFFTDSLVKQLRAVGLNRITYTELLDLLPTLPDQHPQCEGKNKDRFLFDVQGPVHDPLACVATVKEDGTIEVEAGSLRGVVVGTQFVPERDAAGEKRIFVAVSVNVGSSILRPIVPMNDLALAAETRLVVSDWKNNAAMMKVFVHTSDKSPLATSDLSVPRMRPSFVVVDSVNDADLAVTRSSDEEFILRRLDPKISQYVTQDMKMAIAIEKLPYALDAVANFNYFLGKHNAGSPLVNDVKLEMYRLKGEYGSRVPDMELGDFAFSNEVRFLGDPTAKYGFAICNFSQYDLFPYLFYFDPATYSVDAWYLPESKTMQAPLPAKSGADPTRVTIGYGAGGGYAFQFVLPEGATSDTGFLKLFVSTKYLDLKAIEQPPAAEAGRGRGSEARVSVDAELWAAEDVAITMYTEEHERH